MPTFVPRAKWYRKAHGDDSEATQDDRYTQVECWILMAGTAGSADLVSPLNQEEVQWIRRLLYSHYRLSLLSLCLPRGECTRLYLGRTNGCQVNAVDRQTA